MRSRSQAAAATQPSKLLSPHVCCHQAARSCCCCFCCCLTKDSFHEKRNPWRRVFGSGFWQAKFFFLLRIFDFAVECMMRWRKDGIYKWVKPNTPKAIEPNLGPGGQTIPASGLSCSIRRMAESTSRLVGTSQGHQTGG